MIDPTEPTCAPWKVLGVSFDHDGSGTSFVLDIPASKANARLIEAAPDLLAALEWLETHLRDTPHHNAPAAARAREVIRKARMEK